MVLLMLRSNTFRSCAGIFLRGAACSVVDKNFCYHQLEKISRFSSKCFQTNFITKTAKLNPHRHLTEISVSNHGYHTKTIQPTKDEGFQGETLLGNETSCCSCCKKTNNTS